MMLGKPGLQLPWDNLTRQSLFESNCHLESNDDSVHDTDEVWAQLNKHLENFLRSPDDVRGQVFGSNLDMQQPPSQQPTSLAHAVPAPPVSKMPPVGGPRSSQLEAPKPKLNAKRTTFSNDMRLILGVMEPGSTVETHIPLDLHNPVHLCLVKSLVDRAEGKANASYDIQDQAPAAIPKVSNVNFASNPLLCMA